VPPEELSEAVAHGPITHPQIMKSGWLSIMVRSAHPTLTLNFEL
jgi:hypothetical protein